MSKIFSVLTVQASDLIKETGNTIKKKFKQKTGIKKSCPSFELMISKKQWHQFTDLWPGNAVNNLLEGYEYKLFKVINQFHKYQALYYWKLKNKKKWSTLLYIIIHRGTFLNKGVNSEFSYLRAQVLMDLEYSNWWRIHTHIPQLKKDKKTSVATEKQRYMHPYQIQIHFNARWVKYAFVDLMDYNN